MSLLFYQLKISRRTNEIPDFQYFPEESKSPGDFQDLQTTCYSKRDYYLGAKQTTHHHYHHNRFTALFQGPTG